MLKINRSYVINTKPTLYGVGALPYSGADLRSKEADADHKPTPTPTISRRRLTLTCLLRQN